MDRLAALGFNACVNCPGRDGWPEEVRLGHDRGMSMIARWPLFADLGLGTEEFSFRDSEGHSNAAVALVSGPSAWCPEVEIRSLAALPALAKAGWDGVLIHQSDGDRPFPTAWHRSPFPDRRKSYWAFDEWARNDWNAQHRGRTFPAKAGDAADQEAYRWYQDGWLRRLGVFTAAALALGFRHVWTWFIPMNWYEPETMADGTADSVPGLENWRVHTLEDGGDPLFVCGHLFGMGPQWEPRARVTIREVTGELGWRLIIGAELANHRNLLNNWRYNPEEAHRLGACGIYGSDQFLYGEDVPPLVWPA